MQSKYYTCLYFHTSRTYYISRGQIVASGKVSFHRPLRSRTTKTAIQVNYFPYIMDLAATCSLPNKFQRPSRSLCPPFMNEEGTHENHRSNCFVASNLHKEKIGAGHDLQLDNCGQVIGHLWGCNPAATVALLVSRHHLKLLLWIDK